MDGRSLTPQEIKLQELKNIFPEVFAEGILNVSTLSQTKLLRLALYRRV